MIANGENGLERDSKCMYSDLPVWSSGVQIEVANHSVVLVDVEGEMWLSRQHRTQSDRDIELLTSSCGL